MRNVRSNVVNFVSQSSISKHKLFRRQCNIDRNLHYCIRTDKTFQRMKVDTFAFRNMQKLDKESLIGIKHRSFVCEFLPTPIENVSIFFNRKCSFVGSVQPWGCHIIFLCSKLTYFVVGVGCGFETRPSL